MTKRLLLIDGHSMAYRAFYALPAENFTTAQGQHTNAIYGFATMLLSLLSSEKPTHVAVAFDVSRKTFRSEIFPEYKANRAKTPDEFRSQMSYLHELVTAFGITTFEVEGFEADDVIATITKQAEREGAEILICTGDRDSFQLVNEKTTVLYPKRGVSDLARMTPDAVQEKYGMSPEQYPGAETRATIFHQYLALAKRLQQNGLSNTVHCTNSSQTSTNLAAKLVNRFETQLTM